MGPLYKATTALFVNSGLFWPSVTTKPNAYQQVGNEAQ